MFETAVDVSSHRHRIYKLRVVGVSMVIHAMLIDLLLEISGVAYIINIRGPSTDP